jgi:hypothetical protein
MNTGVDTILANCKGYRASGLLTYNLKHHPLILLLISTTRSTTATFPPARRDDSVNASSPSLGTGYDRCPREDAGLRTNTHDSRKLRLLITHTYSPRRDAGQACTVLRSSDAKPGRSARARGRKRRVLFSIEPVPHQVDFDQRFTSCGHLTWYIPQRGPAGRIALAGH